MSAAISKRTTPAGSRSANAITEQFDSLACISSRDEHRAVAREAGEPGHCLQVRGPAGVIRIPLECAVLHIGRGLTADLHLDDASTSRRHAIIIPQGSGHRILDDRSMNGTFVNGVRIEQMDLHDRDVIGLGQCELVYLEA
jgi:hypothetical protein